MPKEDQRKIALAHQEVLKEHARFGIWEYLFYIAVALFVVFVVLVKGVFE